MDTNSIWWVWIIIGIIFLFVELFTTSFFGLWMALAAIVPAFISFIFPTTSIEIQILCWIISMIICAWLWMRLSKRDTPPMELDNQLIGQIGILAKSCGEQDIGILLLQKPVAGNTQWQCIANQTIPADTRVIIKEKINSTLVRVDFEKNPTN